MERFTKRETEILKLLAKGLDNRQICAALKIKEPTLQSHFANIYRWLEVSGNNKRTNASLFYCKYIFNKIYEVTEQYIKDCAGFTCEGMEKIQKLVLEVIKNEIHS